MSPWVESFKRFFLHDRSDEAGLDQAHRLAKDTNLLTLIAVTLFIVGAATTVLAAWAGWAGALLLCFAFFGAALFFVFLFGIPKSGGNLSADVSRVSAESSLAVNTNLERISDWLTKIIVGLGVVVISARRLRC